MVQLRGNSYFNQDLEIIDLKGTKFAKLWKSVGGAKMSVDSTKMHIQSLK